MNEPKAVADARRALGARLAELRDAAGLRQRQLAIEVNYGRSSVANVETGAQRVPRQFWIRCDEVLGTGGVLTESYDRIEGLRRELVYTASEHLTAMPSSRSPGTGPGVDPVLVPHWTRLLQTLTTSHNLLGPRQIHEAVTYESAIIRRYRGEAVGEVKTGLFGVEARWAEFASWTADNVGDRPGAASWLQHAIALARHSGDGAMVAYVLMRQAQQAADRLDGPTAAALATTAGASRLLSLRDRALCAVREAQGHALRGDADGCRAALRKAYRFVARADESGDGGDPATIGVHCVRSYVQAHEGYCQLRLGRPNTAITLLEQALTAWPGAFRQDEGLARAWLAWAYAVANRLPEAGAQGGQALSLLTTAAWSSRTLHTLGQLDARLATTASTTEVAQFRTAFAAAGRTIRP